VGGTDVKTCLELQCNIKTKHTYYQGSIRSARYKLAQVHCSQRHKTLINQIFQIVI